MGVDGDATTAEVREDRNGGNRHVVRDDSRDNAGWSRRPSNWKRIHFFSKNDNDERNYTYKVTFYDHVTCEPMSPAD
jgi:hypothetical protein